MRTYGSGQEQYALFRGWLDSASPQERRALFEEDARVLVGRRVLAIQYWDIHDFGQGAMPWDHGDWHHAVMGVGLDTDRGPAAVTWTSRFHPYGVEVFDGPIEEHLRMAPDGPQHNGPHEPSPWASLLGQECRAVHVTWWDLQLGPARLSDGTVVERARCVDVPVGIRLDFDAQSVWLVAAIPKDDALTGAFVGGDEIMVVFRARDAQALGIE